MTVTGLSDGKESGAKVNEVADRFEERMLVEDFTHDPSDV